MAAASIVTNYCLKELNLPWRIIFFGKMSLMSPIVIKCANQSLTGCRNKRSFVPVVVTFE